MVRRKEPNIENSEEGMEMVNVYSFIADIYIAPLQVGLLRRAPDFNADE